jgi:hypothetical protein
MRANIAILTDTSKAVSQKAVIDYAAGVYAHISHDFGQHSQIRPYDMTPYQFTDPTIVVAVNAAFYTGVKDTGSKIIFSNYVSSTTYSYVNFLTVFKGHWFPIGHKKFGADVTGSILVATTGTYKFSLSSDDGSYLFIDGVLRIRNGGEHGIQARTANVTLTAGQHAFEVQFWENGLAASGFNLTLPTGVILGAIASTERVISTSSMFMLVSDPSGNDVPVLLPAFNGGQSNITGPPIIVRQPQDLTVAQTVTAQFSVSAISDIALSYQWYKNSVLMTAQTQSTLTLLNVLKTDAAAYNCVVTNANGTVSTRAAQLIVGGKPSLSLSTFNGGGGFNPLNPFDPFGIF